MILSKLVPLYRAMSGQQSKFRQNYDYRISNLLFRNYLYIFNNKGAYMNSNKKHPFQRDSKYFTISCYVVAVVLISIIAFRVINNWESTMKLLSAIVRVIGPYFIGFLIAYLVNPLVNFLYGHVYRDLLKIKNKKIKTACSIFSAYLIILGLIVICVSYIVPQLIKSISELITQFPDFYNRIVEWINAYVSKNPDIDADTIYDITNNYLPKMQDYLLAQLQKIIPALYGAGISLIRFFINFFIAIIVSIYLICDKQRILKYMKTVSYAILPAKEEVSGFFDIVKDCNAICKSFFIGKTIDSLIIGVLCFIFMSILKLPYAMLISVIVAITNMIPYFGPYIGAIPGCIILFIEKPMHGIFFLILIICLQSFDGMILGPRILGNSTGLRPIMILFAISCGGAIAGPLGMFLGVPIFGIISYLVDKLIDHRLRQKNMTKESEM